MASDIFCCAYWPLNISFIGELCSTLRAGGVEGEWAWAEGVKHAGKPPFIQFTFVRSESTRLARISSESSISVT